MATSPSTRRIEYPSGDGKPLAETPTHRDNLLGLIDMLRRHFAGDPTVYISGNMFVYYEPGNKRKHVAPDDFVVRGVEPKDRRDVYLVWEEGKGPEFVVEMTSKSTKKEDLETKFQLYRDVLGVHEYFLFDPFEEYLKPSLQGFRLVDGQYVPIEPVDGRLPSEVIGLHLERVGSTLRLRNPETGLLIPTSEEVAAEAEARLQQTEAALRQTQEEVERLRRLLDTQQHRPPSAS